MLSPPFVSRMLSNSLPSCASPFLVTLRRPLLACRPPCLPPRWLHTTGAAHHGGSETSDQQLSDLQGRWRNVESPKSLPKLLTTYSKLSKGKLSGLVVLTTMAGYAMAPAALDMATLLCTSLGTGLCVCSANSFNQIWEVPFDAQMSRTAGRVILNGQLSTLHALMFALTTGASGVYLLHSQVNSLVASLGAANILLYAFIYTIMKRTSIANTWVGALVGGVPPLMGWAACTGALEPGSFVLGFLLYAWQFPHFNALSWNLREDYTRAGYRMMAVINPALNGRVAFRYSLWMIVCCAAAPWMDLTDPFFALDSILVNGPLAYLSWKFYRHSNSKSARRLFFASIVHLPIILSLMLLHKKRQQQPAKDSPST
eukprot:Sdes_comp18433_c0_seq1m8351